MTKQEEVYFRITELIKKSRELDELHINETDNLLEHGYVDSLTLVDLIALLEELAGHEIHIEDYSIRSIYTMESIYKTFFSENKMSQV